MPPTMEGQITMEKTPAYFVHPQVPSRVHVMNAQMKLILVVRNPVSRALSDYTQSLERKGPSIGSFEQYAIHPRTGAINTSWNAIRLGLYAKHLDNWLRHFPAEQIYIVSGEQLIANPGEVLQGVQHFLGISPIVNERHFYFDPSKGFPCVKKSWRTGSPHCLGRNKGRPHPKLRPYVLANLKEFYRSHNLAFYNMTGFDFGWESSDTSQPVKL